MGEHVNTDIFSSLSTNPYTKRSNERWEGTYYQKTFIKDVQYFGTDQVDGCGWDSYYGLATHVARHSRIFDPAEATETARKVNDQMHKLYRTGPHADRFLTWGCVAI
jgi:hypothetical protein